MAYYFSKTPPVGFEEAVCCATEALKQQGFGIVTEIDVKETLQKKLGIEFRNYRILGACNPALAREARELEDKLGTMLPCNVVVQETPGGAIEIAAIDPVASMAAIENPRLKPAAERVREKLQKSNCQPLNAPLFAVTRVCRLIRRFLSKACRVFHKLSHWLASWPRNVIARLIVEPSGL